MPEPETEEYADQTGPDTSQALHRISELSSNLAFVNRSGQPILSLPEGVGMSEEPEAPSAD